LCFYRALKVYPQPRELISIYDKTVPKVSCAVCSNVEESTKLELTFHTAHPGYPRRDDCRRPKYICLWPELRCWPCDCRV